MMKFIKVSIVVVGLFMAYMKTAEAMVQFAPHSFMGFTDPSLPYLWAYISAMLVEGVAIVAFGNLRNSRKDTPTQGISWAIAGLAVAFSIIMNLIDQAINTGHFSGGAGTPAGGLLYSIMGLIPIIVAVMFGVMEIVDYKIPDRGQSGRNNPFQNARREEPYQVMAQPQNHQPSHQWQGPANQTKRIPDNVKQAIKAPEQVPSNGRTSFEDAQEEVTRLVDQRHPTPPA